MRSGPVGRIVAAEAVVAGAFVLAGRAGALLRDPTCGKALQAPNDNMKAPAAMALL